MKARQSAQYPNNEVSKGQAKEWQDDLDSMEQHDRIVNRLKKQGLSDSQIVKKLQTKYK